MLDVPDFNTSIEDPPPVPGSGPKWGRFAFFLLLAAGAAFGARQYLGRPAAVLAADRAAGTKPVLMMFTADWCGPCQMFKAQVLADDRVVYRVVRGCRFEKVDLTKWDGQPAAIARHYSVNAIPTLMVVNSRGDEVDRYSGAFDPSEFDRWLSKYAPTAAQ